MRVWIVIRYFLYEKKRAYYLGLLKVNGKQTVFKISDMQEIVLNSGTLFL